MPYNLSQTQLQPSHFVQPRESLSLALCNGLFVFGVRNASDATGTDGLRLNVF